MKWGSFGAVHIASLAVGAAIIVLLYVALKKAPQKVQKLVLGVLSFSGMAAVVFNFVTWGSPLEYLPLHLCSLNALVLPIAVFTGNKTLGNLLLLWSLGALAAVVVNTAQAEFEIFSATFCFYVFPHVLEFGIPILLFKLGLVEKDEKCIGSTLLITVAAYTAIHFINMGINSWGSANGILNQAGEPLQVNYMYSLVPEIPLMQAFYDLIPYPYWYLYCVIPIVAVYLLIVYAPQLLRRVKKQKIA